MPSALGTRFDGEILITDRISGAVWKLVLPDVEGGWIPAHEAMFAMLTEARRDVEEDLDGVRFQYTALEADVGVERPLLARRASLAVELEYAGAWGTRDVPFYLMPALGGDERRLAEIDLTSFRSAPGALLACCRGDQRRVNATIDRCFT